MNVKKKVASCAVKKTGEKNGKKYTIYEVVFDDGIRADCFDECKEGEEVEGELTDNVNPAYNPSFKLNKPSGGKGFPAKDWTSEKRIASLKCAVDLVCAGKITLEKLDEAREKFFQYLNTK